MGIPRVLNLWSTHQFWIGFLGALGIDARQIEFSSDSSEDQAREFAKGRGTVDCCYPVKCVSGHYGELLARDRTAQDRSAALADDLRRCRRTSTATSSARWPARA